MSITRACRRMVFAAMALLLLSGVWVRAEEVVGYVDEETGLVFYQASNHLWGLATAEGEILVKPLYADPDWDFYLFREGPAAVYNEGGYWGYIDTTGVLVVPHLYDMADEFAEVRAVVEADCFLWIHRRGGAH